MDYQLIKKQRVEKLLEQLEANPQMLEPIEALLELVESEKAMGRKADDIEEDILKQMRALGKASLQGWAEHASQAASKAAKGHVHAKKKLWWLSSLGRIEVNETLKREGRARVRRPFKESSAVKARGTSRLLCRALVDFGAEKSFEKAARSVREHYGLEVSATRVREESLRAAKKLPQESPAPVRTLEAGALEAIVVQADGTMIPVMQTARQAQGDQRKQRRVLWKEMRLEAAQAQGSARTHYAAGFDTPEQAGARWTQTARAAGWCASTYIHGVGDGAEWISAQFEQHFAAHGKYLLDMYHACEYLGECAPEGQEAGAWLEKTKEALRQNRAGEIIEELSRREEAPGHAEEDAPIRRARRYLDKRRGQLDYKRALERGLPIGSGLIESGHRHVLQERLKIPGAWWKEQNAHAMAQLRVFRANGLWEQLWLN